MVHIKSKDFAGYYPAQQLASPEFVRRTAADDHAVRTHVRDISQLLTELRSFERPETAAASLQEHLRHIKLAERMPTVHTVHSSDRKDAFMYHETRLSRTQPSVPTCGPKWTDVLMEEDVLRPD